MIRIHPNEKKHSSDKYNHINRSCMPLIGSLISFCDLDLESKSKQIVQGENWNFLNVLGVV